MMFNVGTEAKVATELYLLMLQQLNISAPVIHVSLVGLDCFRCTKGVR